MIPTVFDEPSDSCQNEGNRWVEALRQLPVGSEPGLLFHERRVDGRIDLIPGANPREFVGYQAGLCIDLPALNAHRFRAAPTPGEISRIVADWEKNRPSMWPEEPGIEVDDPLGGDFRRQLHRIREMLTVAMAEGGNGSEAWRPRVAWVGFDQRVCGRDDLGRVWADHRRGSRVRIEVWNRQARRLAVRERVLGCDDDLQQLSSLLEDAYGQARRLQAGGAPKSPPASTQNMVLAPSMGGVLVHELVGHALEGDRAPRSWLRDLPRGASTLHVIDDPGRSRGRWQVDDEGVEALATDLIRQGRPVGALHDRRSARAAGVTSNGHGRRGSFRDPVLPRMGAIYVEEGSEDPSRIVAEVPDGIYVSRIEGASADVQSGRGSFRVTEAWRIRKGRFEEPLTPFVFRFDGLTLLRAAIVQGNDLTFDTTVGSCHRYGQPLATTVGAPTMWIGSVEIKS